MDSIRLLKELIRIKSSNPGGYEEGIAEYISNILRKNSIEHQIIYSAKKRANIIGYLKGKSEQKLILCGHLDTKPPSGNWSIDPFLPKIKKGKLYGLGASDMKGGIAAMLSAIIKNSKRKMNGDVEFLFVADEEMNSTFGLKYLLKKKYVNKGNFAIIGEPTNLKLATASLGNLWITIKVKGKKAHAGMYWRGVNAIDVTIEIISQIKKILNKKKYSYKNFPLLRYFPHLNLGIISGGSHPGSVPDYCEATIDIRFKNENEGAIFRRQLEKIIYRISTKYGCECMIEQFGGGGLPPWDLSIFKTNEISSYLELIKRSYINAKQTLIKSVFLGGSDAGIFMRELKIPTVIIGPGSLEQAHSPDEWVSINEVIKASKIYDEIIRGW